MKKFMPIIYVIAFVIGIIFIITAIIYTFYFFAFLRKVIK